jgi:hypothetical protein
VAFVYPAHPDDDIARKKFHLPLQLNEGDLETKDITQI